MDYTQFNNTYEVDTPLCSAKQLDELRATMSTSQKLGEDKVQVEVCKAVADLTVQASDLLLTYCIG